MCVREDWVLVCGVRPGCGLPQPVAGANGVSASAPGAAGDLLPSAPRAGVVYPPSCWRTGVNEVSEALCWQLEQGHRSHSLCAWCQLLRAESVSAPNRECMGVSGT